MWSEEMSSSHCPCDWMRHGAEDPCVALWEEAREDEEGARERRGLRIHYAANELVALMGVHR